MCSDCYDKGVELGLCAMDNFLNLGKLAADVVTVLSPFCWFITRTDIEEDLVQTRKRGPRGVAA